MYVTAYNTSPDPVTVDAEGRAVHAGDYGTVDTTYPAVRDALAAGSLMQVKVDPATSNDAACAAAAHTDAVTARAERLGRCEKDELATAAAEAGVSGAEDMGKAELVAALAVRLDVDVPERHAAADVGEASGGSEDTATERRARRGNVRE